MRAALGELEWLVIDAIGCGNTTVPAIVGATGLQKSTVWWRLCLLRKAHIVNAEPLPGRGTPKRYRLNPWCAKP